MTNIARVADSAYWCQECQLFGPERIFGERCIDIRLTADHARTDRIAANPAWPEVPRDLACKLEDGSLGGLVGHIRIRDLVGMHRGDVQDGTAAGLLHC